MSLTLTIIKSPNGIAQPTDVKAFPTEGGSIGRGQENTWALPDPERFLSSRHCDIRFENGRYYILDQSTNGTFVNGAAEPVGKGGRAPLNNGDTFEIGEYQFRVTLEDSLLAGAGGSFGASPFADVPPMEDSQFGTVTANPFADGVHFGENLALSPDAEKVDPLRALDEAGGGDPFARSGSSPASFPIDDPFKQSGSSSTYNKGGSFGDGADPLSQSVQWPDAHQQNVIPDDWDDDLMGGAPPEPGAKARNLIPEDETLSGFGAPPVPPPTPRRPAPPPAEAPRPEVPKPQLRKAREELKRPPRAEPAPTPPPPASPPPARGTVAPGNVSPQVPALVIDSLIEAMGLDSKQFSADQKREIGRIAGELMREVTAGMMQLLRSRTSLKNEFRMNVTTIQPIENNPLKFSANVDEALENMFVRQSAAYKGPVDAFREGYQSIAEHQVAIIAGVRSAFKSIMESFNPERLAKNFDRGKKSAGLPMMNKAKYWSAYTDYYENLVDNMEHSFQHLFGDDFVQAYEDQLSKLAAQRKK